MILMNAILIISLAPLVKKINRTLNQMFRHSNCFLRAYTHKPNLYCNYYFKNYTQFKNKF